ncbi:uncharacterized protein LOC133821122 [Humulus lupulus]|uniref:uncharacterized protein LOC133821122 n=1 Tax=Humulus lupulus TaxID=3486 RepID=UPI002B402427|nr:uncharacterized protein LOC133821122 [Humulus lupulus]
MISRAWFHLLHQIGTQLAKYETTKEVWDHLARLYTQSNFVKQYQSYIRALEQKDISIQEFYSVMTNLWDQLALTESAELRAFAPYIARREEQRLVQFLMALRGDIEGLRGSIFHHTSLPSVDSVVSELLAYEILLKSQLGKGILTAPSPSVLVVPPRSFTHNENKPHRKVGVDECNFFKQKGHWKNQCPKLVNRAPQQQRHHFRPPHHGNQHQLSNQLPHYGNQPHFGNQSQSRPYHPPQFNVAATLPPSDSYDFGSSSSNSALAALSEQFQKFLTMQSHAMSVYSSIGQPPTST